MRHKRIFTKHALEQFYKRATISKKSSIVLEIEKYVFNLPIYEKVVIRLLRQKDTFFIFIIKSNTVITSMWVDSKYMEKKFEGFKIVDYTNIRG